MAFEIRLNPVVTPDYYPAARLEDYPSGTLAALKQAFQESRFTYGEMEIYRWRGKNHTYGWGVRIHTIRLREAKPYCGNHPGPCQRAGGRRHAKARFCEGLDWVSVCNLVNDVLDHLRLSADCKSSALNFRKGHRRRLCYDQTFGLYGHAGWLKEAEYADYGDYCGREPPTSDYVPGTPGILGWRRECATQEVA